MLVVSTRLVEGLHSHLLDMACVFGSALGSRSCSVVIDSPLSAVRAKRSSGILVIVEVVVEFSM